MNCVSFLTYAKKHVHVVGVKSQIIYTQKQKQIIRESNSIYGNIWQ